MIGRGLLHCRGSPPAHHFHISGFFFKCLPGRWPPFPPAPSPEHLAMPTGKQMTTQSPANTMVVSSGIKLYEQIHVLSHKHITPSITPPPMTTAVRGEHITLVSFGGGSERKIPRLARPPPAAKSALDMPQLCDSIGNLWQCDTFEQLCCGQIH